MITNIYKFIKEKHNIEINGQQLFKLFGKGNRTKHMIFVDAESDGLWGKGFCISMIVIDIRSGEIMDSFTKKAKTEITVPWVKENVLPVIEDIPESPSLKDLREEFWAYWEDYRKYSITFADSGFPVEANWFRDCVNDDIENRQWNAPFPLHDIATTVLMSGIGNVKRKEYSRLNEVLEEDYQHNPYFDNLASAITMILATHKILNSSELIMK